MRYRIAASTLLVALGAINFATADNNGLGRAVAKAGARVSAPGLGRSSASLKSSASLSSSASMKSSASLSRSGNGLSRAGALQRAPGLARIGKLPGGSARVRGEVVAGPKDPAARQEHHLRIAERNRDHRLGQALKLRGLAEKNGDAELMANADRMEASAHERYEARVDHLDRFGAADLSLNSPEGEVVGDGVVVEVEPLPSPELDITVETPPLDTKPTTPRAAARASWMSKLRGAR